MQKLFDLLKRTPGCADLLQLVTKFFHDEGPRYSAALTYTSLFAVVPLLTVIYSLLAALPVFQGLADELQLKMFNHLMPATGEVIQGYLSGFAKQARQLTLVGVGVLILTAGLMIVNIEKAFNHLWQEKKQRKGLQAFLIYWATLTLGPLLIGAAMLLSSYLTTLPLLAQLDGYTGGNIASLWRFLPFVMSGLAFTLMYWAVPNCKVKLSHAAQGGFAMALLFELAKRLFTWFVASFPSYEFIYGAFAAFPLFLLWSYISWILILFCAQWVALQGLKQKGNLTLKGAAHPPAVQSLLILHLLWEAFNKAEGVEEAQLAGLATSLDWLKANNWAAFNPDTQTWQPARNFNTASLAELINQLPWALPPVASWPEEARQLEKLLAAVAALETQRNQQLNQPLASYF